MPKDLEESADLIISNMTFRYCVLPDIALLNSVNALAPGGYLRISFTPTGYNSVDRVANVTKVFNKLKQLSPKYLTIHNIEELQSNNYWDYVIITKHKSTKKVLQV